MYQWFVVLGSVFAFTYGFGTGSNDVANAFGTSVGSKTLTMRQAVLIAFVFEFVGAIVLGRVSTNTIAGGVADIVQFKQHPDVYAYGMMISLGVAGFLQIFASYLGLNISATHSIIGCIMGFSLVFKGWKGVLWAVPDTTGTTFPPYKGVVPIFFSWAFSPVLTGIASALVFTLCRTLVLRRKESAIKALWVLPLAVFLTTWVNIYFVFTKGAKKMIASNDAGWSDHKAAMIALYIAIGCTGLTSFVALPLIHRKAKRHFEVAEIAESIEGQEMEPSKVSVEVVEIHGVDEPEEAVDAVDAVESGLVKTYSQKFMKAIMHGTSYDIHEHIEEDELVAAMHKSAEVFDPKAEYIFSFLQVFSAICVVFAHGAGEVGYMAGPLATIWDFYQHGAISKKVTPPIWIILISAFGLVFGLSLYGYKVTQTMGVKLSKLSPARGFAAELATSMVIMVASQFGLPTSSSQCITGGIIGIGLMEGMRGVNWKFFAVQVSSWAVNLFLSLGIVAAIFAQGMFAPSYYQGQKLEYIVGEVNNITKQIARECNVSYSSTLGPRSSAPVIVSTMNNALQLYRNGTWC